MVLEITKLILE